MERSVDSESRDEVVQALNENHIASFTHRVYLCK